MLKFFLILLLVNLLIWICIGIICVGCLIYISVNKELKDTVDLSDYDEVCEATPLLETSVLIGKAISSTSFLVMLLIAGGLMIWMLVSGLISAIKAL